MITIKIILLIIGIAYFTYLYFFDCRQIADERRELIRMKSLRISQKINLVVLIILIFANCFYSLASLTILAVLTLSFVSTEIAAKIYFSKTL